jgi:hypothetical protein
MRSNKFISSVLRLVLLASMALANPIGVSGSGTFSTDLEVTADSFFSVSFSGSNGIDSVFMNAPGCTGPLRIAVTCSQTLGFAQINGVIFGSGNGGYSFSLGDLNDFVSGRDATHGQFAGVSIIGSIEITSQQCVPNVVCTGSFLVVPTPQVPEPGTGGFVFLGASLIVFCG